MPVIKVCLGYVREEKIWHGISIEVREQSQAGLV